MTYNMVTFALSHNPCSAIAILLQLVHSIEYIIVIHSYCIHEEPSYKISV